MYFSAGADASDRLNPGKCAADSRSTVIDQALTYGFVNTLLVPAVGAKYWQGRAGDANRPFVVHEYRRLILKKLPMLASL